MGLEDSAERTEPGPQGQQLNTYNSQTHGTDSETGIAVTGGGGGEGAELSINRPRAPAEQDGLALETCVQHCAAVNVAVTRLQCVERAEHVGVLWLHRGICRHGAVGVWTRGSQAGWMGRGQETRQAEVTRRAPGLCARVSRDVGRPPLMRTDLNERH